MTYDDVISTGLLISNIDIDIDSIDDTFAVSISVSTILLGQGLRVSKVVSTIPLRPFLTIFRYRYFRADVNKMSTYLITKS